MNELTKVFKSVFDGNLDLIRLMNGDQRSLDFMAYEDLIKLGYIVEELNAENAASMNENKPCIMILSEDEGVFGSKYVNVQVIFRNDCVYMGADKLRYMEILTEISNAIHQKAVYDDGILELETVKCVPIDNRVSAVVASFRINNEEIVESEPRIISYYKEEMFGKLREVFESEGVKDCLCINGEYGSRMSFEEMMEKGFVRLAPATQADFTLKNTYAVVQIDYVVGIEMTVNLIASSGGVYMDLTKAETGMASDLISKRLTAAENVIMTSNDVEELSENIISVTMKFSMDASKEDVERIESRNKIDIRFFAGLDVLQAVPFAEMKVGGQVAGIAVDLINGPYRLTFANKEILEYGFHMRYAFGVDDNPMFKVTMKSLEAEPEIELKQQFDEASFNMVMSMMMSMSNLSAFLDGVDITGQFAEMDVEKEGILLYLDNGEIKFKRVSGAERPDLPCNNMGNIEMGRPYADELGEALNQKMNDIADAETEVAAAENEMADVEEDGPSINEMTAAAEAGEIDMIIALAGIYAEGKAKILDEELGEYVEIKPDAAKAAEYYKKGAEMGDMACTNHYGMACILGSGVTQDRKAGFEYFLKAAEMGYGLAMQNVGMCYENADGTEFNLEKALQWYEKSLEAIPNEEIKIKVDLLKQYLEEI